MYIDVLEVLGFRLSSDPFCWGLGVGGAWVSPKPFSFSLAEVILQF